MEEGTSDRLGTLLSLTVPSSQREESDGDVSTPSVRMVIAVRVGPTGTLYSYEGFQSGIRRNNGQWRAAFHR